MSPSREAQESAPPKALRHRLPGERASITHKFAIAGHEGYITVGLYKDGTPGELFIRMAKEGSTVSGLMDSFATAVSLALQHGVPLKLLCDKFQHTRFEPSGFTGNQEIPDCQVSDGLHLPLAGNPLRVRTAVSAVQGHDSDRCAGAASAVGDWLSRWHLKIVERRRPRLRMTIVGWRIEASTQAASTPSAVWRE